MAYEILSTVYLPIKPLLSIRGDSLGELPTDGVAEGSKAQVGGTEYVFENNSGWIVPGSGGSGGGGGNVTIVGADFDQTALAMTLDKTFSEIVSAAMVGVVILSFAGQFSYLSYLVVDDNSYNVEFFGPSGKVTFSATSEDGYPSVSVSALQQG